MFENLDIVVDILKIGLSGFVFLLIFLAFRLLRKEQNVDKPRPILLKKISQFMWISVALAIIVGFFSLAEHSFKNELKDFEEWKIQGFIQLEGGEYNSKGVVFTVEPPHQKQLAKGEFLIDDIPIYEKSGVKSTKLVANKEGYEEQVIEIYIDDIDKNSSEEMHPYKMKKFGNIKKILIEKETPIILVKKPEPEPEQSRRESYQVQGDIEPTRGEPKKEEKQ